MVEKAGTRYDEYPDHALYGVPQEVLTAAYETLSEAVEDVDMQGHESDLVDSVAESVLANALVAWRALGKDV